MSIPTDYNVLVVFLVPDPCLYDQYAISCTFNGPKRILNNNSFIFLVHNSIADFLVPVPWSQDQYSLKNVKRSYVHFVAKYSIDSVSDVCSRYRFSHVSFFSLKLLRIRSKLYRKHAYSDGRTRVPMFFHAE